MRKKFWLAIVPHANARTLSTPGTTAQAQYDRNGGYMCIYAFGKCIDGDIPSGYFHNILWYAKSMSACARILVYECVRAHSRILSAPAQLGVIGRHGSMPVRQVWVLAFSYGRGWKVLSSLHTVSPWTPQPFLVHYVRGEQKS